VVAPIGKISGRIADITGATMTDVANLGRNMSTLKRAGEIQKQATAIEAIAGHLSSQQKARALSYLDEAYKRSSTGKSGAAALYQAARDAFHAAEKGSRTSKFAADKMRALGDRLEADARSGIHKAAFATAGTIAYETSQEHKINTKREAMRKVFDENDVWTEPAEPPMSMGRMIAAAVAGVHGNMAEKPISRYGNVDHVASSAAWRAQHDMITSALKDGVITKEEAQKSYKALQDEEPFFMGGKAPWLTAPASAAAIVWKVGDQIDKARRSTTDRRQMGSYIDGDTLTGESGRTNRLLDINAPEVAHAHSNDPNHPERRTGEYLGPESAAFADKLIKEGQYFRRVEDSNPEAGGTTYGRDVRSIETLPRPFDKLLAIPGVGNYIPAQDFATRMIRAGMGDIDYRELTKYKGDNLKQHDEARLAAIADGIGIWSKPAQDAYAEYARTNANFKPWVGTEDTMYDRKVKREAKKGFDIPKEPASDWGTWAGLGLMTSGQSGLFGAMGEGPGSAAAWTWNAGVAIAGLYDHTQKAIRSPAPRKYSKQPGVPSALDRRVAERDRESRERALAVLRQKTSP
jgi:endonuclease YncB( thermonuclease family)